MPTEFISTNKNVHFINNLHMYDCEYETLNLLGSKYIINGISIEAKQPLNYKMIFYGNNKFHNTDLSIEKCIGSVDLNLSEPPTFRINNKDQYILNIEDLEIIYEDFTKLNKLYVGLMNLSNTPKLQGLNGEMQVIIKMTTRI